MTTERPDVDVLALLERLRSDETLVKAVAVAAHDQGRANRMLPEAEIMRHVSAILDAIAAAAGGDPAELARAGARADDLAIDRLEQGVSLQDVLLGFRVGRQVVVQRLIDLGRELYGSDALLPLLAPMDNLVGSAQESMILAYRSAELELLRSRRTARIEALRELLGGGSLDWAAEAGLDPAGRYHCVVADVSIPREARRLQQAWAAGHGVSGIVHGYLTRVATDLPAKEPAADLAVVSPRVSVDELAGTYALCRQALGTYRARRTVGRQPLLGAAQDIATATQPLLGRMLARELLAHLDPGDEFHRELAITARAFIASGHRAEQAAASLHIHANTLRYRLRRFHELTGAVSPDRSLASDLSTWWALHTWLLPAAPADGRGHSSSRPESAPMNGG